ncbi:hypothetical protein DB346_01025 [Verrucomicrobia bacterium LW23]|nr:hypothetical protein DB346_01025 [Verrucomicrobia bacterium LW23]
MQYQAASPPGDSGEFYSLRFASSYVNAIPSAAAPRTKTSAEIHEEASAITRKGIALLDLHPQGQALTPERIESLHEAIRCFDIAIQLRNGLPLGESSWYRYGLIAGWLNRGDAHTRLGSAQHLENALLAYDEALALLHDLPLAENPLFPRRVAIAHINRGFALQSQADQAKALPSRHAEISALASDSFRAALAALSRPEAAAVDDRLLLSLGAAANLSVSLLSVTRCDYAREALAVCQNALESGRSLETEDIAIALHTMKLRHLLCQALAVLDADPIARTRTEHEWAALTTNAIDEGLALSRHWEALGDARLRPLSQELFRFGCRVYSRHLPQFLAEFVMDNLAGVAATEFSPGVHNAALIAVWQAWHEIEKANPLPQNFRSVTPESAARFEELLSNLRQLRIAEDRLESMRREATTAGRIAPPQPRR